MTGAMARRKGATYQRAIRQWFDSHGYTTMVRQAGEDGDDLTILEHPAFVMKGGVAYAGAGQ